MGLSVTYKTECDNCGEIEEEGHSDPRNAGWIRRRHDETTGQSNLFYCCDKCVVEWLRKQGRDKEAGDFENAVWIA